MEVSSTLLEFILGISVSVDVGTSLFSWHHAYGYELVEKAAQHNYIPLLVHCFAGAPMRFVSQLACFLNEWMPNFSVAETCLMRTEYVSRDML
ncbi:hypothetical protein CLOM_g8021 [Closterium sp. NIES-68]|nr:hypothetical protein CLOM_g4937 [Closterium sp. NIES-68]GJP48748.1 hypothetical protein CLOM_g8021 [Closterium sp. NIES-68]GJP85436.1 hypothetical protein CLOP_g15542 [Closterium sp. NIES-67]